MKNKLIALLVFLIYYFGNSKFLSNRIYGGDSAEFAYVGIFFAPAHAPGYPLYSGLLNACRIVLQAAGLPINLGVVSLVLSSLSVAILFLLLLKITKNLPVSLYSSILFGNLFIIRLHSLILEVFSLNNLLILTMTWLLLKFIKEKKQIYSFLSFFLVGLIISNQHIALLFLPAWYLLIGNERKPFFQGLKYKTPLLLAGLLPFFYVSLAALNHPLLDFENATTITGLFNLITRASYGTFRAYQSAAPSLLGSGLSFLSALIFLLQDFRPLGVIFIIMGIVYAVKNRSRLFVFLEIQALIGLFYFFYAGYILKLVFSAATFEKFLTLVYLSLMPFFAVGIKYLYELVNTFIATYSNKKIVHAFSKIIILFILVVYFKTVYQSTFATIEYLPKTKDFSQAAKQILSSTPNGSIIFINHDRWLFPLVYEYLTNEKQYQKKRIYLINPSALSRNFYRQRLKTAISNINLTYDNEKKPVNNFLSIVKTNSINYHIFTDIEMGTDLWVPYGVLWQYVPDKQTLLLKTRQFILADQNFWDRLKPYRLNPQQSNLLYLKDLNQEIISSYENFASFAYISGNKTLAKRLFADVALRLKPETIKPQTLKLFMEEKDCVLAKLYMTYAREEAFYSSSEDLKTLIKYYAFCNIKPKSPEKLMKMYDDLKKKEDIPLKTF